MVRAIALVVVAAGALACAKPRTAGVTKPGFIACRTQEALETALAAVAAGDSAAMFRTMAAQGRSCFALKPGIRVTIASENALFSEIRAEGMRQTLWTPREAVR